MQILNAYAQDTQEILDAVTLAERGHLTFHKDNPPRILMNLANWGDIKSPVVVGDTMTFEASGRLIEWRKTIDKTREEIIEMVKAEKH